MADAAAHLLVVDEFVPAPLKILPAFHQLNRGSFDVVHLRLGVGDGSFFALLAELGVLREVHAEGLVGHLLSLRLDRIEAFHGIVDDAIEISLDERGDVGKLVVVVDDKLEKDASLVRVVGHKVGLGLEPSLVQRADGVLVLAVRRSRPRWDDVRDGGALGHVPLVVHGGDDDELGGPAVGDGAGALSLGGEHSLAVKVYIAGPVEHGHLVGAARGLNLRLRLLLSLLLVVRMVTSGVLFGAAAVVAPERGHLEWPGSDGRDRRVGVPGGLAAVLVVEGGGGLGVERDSGFVGINLDIRLERVAEVHGDDGGNLGVGLGERGDLVDAGDGGGAVSVLGAHALGIEREGHVLVHQVLGVRGHVVIGSDGGVRDDRRGHHARDEDAGGGSLR